MAIEFGAILTLVMVGTWLFAIFDVITAPVDQIRLMQKPLWVLVVLLGFILGAVAWFAVGRPRASERPGGFPRPGGSPRPGGRSRPMAPDDDPEFLRTLRSRPDDGTPPAGV